MRIKNASQCLRTVTSVVAHSAPHRERICLMRRLTKEAIVLDNILNSTLLTLIVAVATAVIATVLQPDPRAGGGGHNPAGISVREVTGPRPPLAADTDTSTPVVQLPKVVVTGHQRQPSEAVSVAATN